MSSFRLGSQVYNLWRTPLDMVSKLQVIAALGYQSADLGLDICGAHVHYPWLCSHLEQVIHCHKELGVHWIGFPRPANADREDVVHAREDIDPLIDDLNRFARTLRSEGLDLYYHCHDVEFRDFGGMTIMDRVLSDTDIMLEVDVYWALKGGCDVMRFLDDNKDRILYLHLKDGDENGSCAIGKGWLPCDAYLEWADANGLKYVVIEDDAQQPDGITSICNSIQEIRRLGYV